MMAAALPLKEEQHIYKHLDNKKGAFKSLYLTRWVIVTAHVRVICF